LRYFAFCRRDVYWHSKSARHVLNENKIENQINVCDESQLSFLYRNKQWESKCVCDCIWVRFSLYWIQLSQISHGSVHKSLKERERDVPSSFNNVITAVPGDFLGDETIFFDTTKIKIYFVSHFILHRMCLSFSLFILHHHHACLPFKYSHWDVVIAYEINLLNMCLRARSRGGCPMITLSLTISYSLFIFPYISRESENFTLVTGWEMRVHA
jgi:hypothetical protein